MRIDQPRDRTNPTQPSMMFSKPLSVLKTNCHTTAITTEEIASGRNTIVRKTSMPLTFRFSTPATARLMRTVGTTVPTVKTTVLRIAIRNSGSEVNRSRKFLRPTNFGGREHIPLLETHVQREAQWKQHEHGDRRHVRCHEQPARPRASAPRAGPSGPRAAGSAVAPGVPSRSWAAQHFVHGAGQSAQRGGRPGPRRTGPKLRSIKATIFSHAGVIGKPCEKAGPSVSTLRLPSPSMCLGESVRSHR